MMDAGCGLICVAVAAGGVAIGLLAVFFTLGEIGRRLKAKSLVAQLRLRGVKASGGVFYGSPGEGWFVVTVDDDDPHVAPHVFQVRDREASVGSLLSEWNRLRLQA